MKRLYILIMTLLISIPMLSAIQVGNTGVFGVNLIPETSSANYSEVNVNNSFYLQGYEPSYFYPASNPNAYINTESDTLQSVTDRNPITTNRISADSFSVNGDDLKSTWISEETGYIADWGINYNQAGNRNDGVDGGFIRFDLRDGYSGQFFNIQSVVNEGIADREIAILKISSEGDAHIYGSLNASSYTGDGSQLTGIATEISMNDVCFFNETDLNKSISERTNFSAMQINGVSGGNIALEIGANVVDGDTPSIVMWSDGISGAKSYFNISADAFSRTNLNSDYFFTLQAPYMNVQTPTTYAGIKTADTFGVYLDSYYAYKKVTMSNGGAGTPVMVVNAGGGTGALRDFPFQVQGRDDNYTLYVNSTNNCVALGQINCEGRFMVNGSSRFTDGVSLVGNLNITGNINITGCLEYNDGGNRATLGTCI